MCPYLIFYILITKDIITCNSEIVLTFVNCTHRFREIFSCLSLLAVHNYTNHLIIMYYMCNKNSPILCHEQYQINYDLCYTYLFFDVYPLIRILLGNSICNGYFPNKIKITNLIYPYYIEKL